MTDDKQITIALDERQEKALGLMLNGRKDKEITEELGISRQTLYRWRKYDANFLQILEERRNMLREQAEDTLQFLKIQLEAAPKISFLGKKYFFYFFFCHFPYPPGTGMFN